MLVNDILKGENHSYVNNEFCSKQRSKSCVYFTRELFCLFTQPLVHLGGGGRNFLGCCRNLFVLKSSHTGFSVCSFKTVFIISLTERKM